MPMCTHLSKYTSDNQSSFGKAEPGRQNKIVKKINAPTGKNRLRVLDMISEKINGQMDNRVLSHQVLVSLGG